MIWREQINSTVKQLWSRYDEFCEYGLNVEIRFEAFTDKCFAGCYQIKLYTSIFLTILFIFVNY